MKGNVWFIADLHIGHKNILRHAKERISSMGLKDETDIEAHDQYIIDMWLSQTQKGDRVYVLGDFIMGDKVRALKILHKLKSNGCKIYFIVGNHDDSTTSFVSMFESMDLIKEVTFKKKNFDFLEQDLDVVMCHYPLKSWNHKCKGALHLYGHIHNNSPWVDYETDDLCINVGFDNPIGGYQLFSLEQIYNIYKEKLHGIPPHKYSDVICETNKRYIR